MLDTLNPNDYIIGVVHLPPGKTGKQVLNNSEPVMALLRKFFKKLNRDPQLKHRRRLPSISEDDALQKDEHLEISAEGDGVLHRLSFAGPCSTGGYCLRQLNTYRLQICLTRTFPEVPPALDATATKEETGAKKRKRRTASISTNDESFRFPLSSPKKSAKRRKLEQP